MSQYLSIIKKAPKPSVVPVNSQTSSLVEVEEVSFNLQGLQLNALARQGAKAESRLPPLQVLIPIVV
jgi:hypothetical protein